MKVLWSQDLGVWNADEFASSVIQEAPDNWKRMTKGGKKDLTGLFDMLLASGQRVILVAPWADEQQKFAACAVIREFAAQHDAVACAVFYEAWIVKTQHGLGGVAPSEHPDRQEFVMLTLLRNDGGENSLRLWPIHRTGKRAELGKELVTSDARWRWDSKTFGDLLPRRERKTH